MIELGHMRLWFSYFGKMGVGFERAVVELELGMRSFCFVLDYYTYFLNTEY